MELEKEILAYCKTHLKKRYDYAYSRKIVTLLGL